MIIRPQDFYLLAAKLALLICAVPALAGFVAGVLGLGRRRAFVLGASWWVLVELAVVVERKAVLFWKELLWITSEYYRPALELLVGIVGFVFSFMLAGTIAAAVAGAAGRFARSGATKKPGKAKAG